MVDSLRLLAVFGLSSALNTLGNMNIGIVKMNMRVPKMMNPNHFWANIDYFSLIIHNKLYKPKLQSIEDLG